jgi:hypothetical protein
MATPLDNACCASLPRDALAALGRLRCRPNLRVGWAGQQAWLYWPAGDVEVLRCVLPLPGAVVYERRGELWYQPRQALPAFEVPEGLATQPLELALTPARFEPEPPRPLRVLPVRLRLVREDTVRPAAALRCRLAELAAWVEMAASHQFAGLQVARCGEDVMVVGSRLPVIPCAERFWGRRVFVPLGYRVEPALPESALCEALGVGDEAIVLFRETDVEVVAGDALRPLNRAGVRLAT